MQGYRRQDNPNLMVVYDNPYLNERRYELTPRGEVERKIEALKGQGCPCGCWELNYWVKIEYAVRSGKYKLSL